MRVFRLQGLVACRGGGLHLRQQGPGIPCVSAAVDAMQHALSAVRQHGGVATKRLGVTARLSETHLRSFRIRSPAPTKSVRIPPAISSPAAIIRGRSIVSAPCFCIISTAAWEVAYEPRSTVSERAAVHTW